MQNLEPVQYAKNRSPLVQRTHENPECWKKALMVAFRVVNFCAGGEDDTLHCCIHAFAIWVRRLGEWLR